MVRSGLDLPADLLAISPASHSGEPMHVAAVRAILAGAGLDEASLQTPPDFPLDPVERDDWLRDRKDRAPIAMNCSGKHASMLATCVVNGWSVADYLHADHPLQRALADHVSTLAGESIEHVGVDGCGAPVLALSLVGLARSMSTCVQADEGSAEHRVVTAMRARPELVGGSRRDVTAFMRNVPGLAAKDGAEGVYVLALPDGRAAALKVTDGADRARIVACAALLVAMGVDEASVLDQRTMPLLGGGVVVGQVSSNLR